MDTTDWPAVAWARHQADCPNPRRCPHPVDLPAWWWSLMYRGHPDDPATPNAVFDAVRTISRFKARPHLPPDEISFVRAIALDALPAAPQPVTPDWVYYTLTSVATLTRWACATGQPINREHLMSERVVSRFVTVGIGHLSGGTRAGYYSRLETLASLLLGRESGKPLITQEPPLEPLTPTQENDLWQWARGLSTSQNRQFFRAVLATGLGAGLFRHEISDLRPENVHIDPDGAVHVTTFRSRTKSSRTVTCRAEWEERLARVITDCPPGHPVVTPWRATANKSNLTARLMRVVALDRAPVPFMTHTLRNTWIARQMEAGAPLTVLMAGSGLVRMCSLEEMLPLTVLPDEVTVAAMLRHGWTGPGR